MLHNKTPHVLTAFPAGWQHEGWPQALGHTAGLGFQLLLAPLFLSSSPLIRQIGQHLFLIEPEQPSPGVCAALSISSLDASRRAPGSHVSGQHHTGITLISVRGPKATRGCVLFGALHVDGCHLLGPTSGSPHGYLRRLLCYQV